MLIRSQDKKTLTKFDFINIFRTKDRVMHDFDEDESVEIIVFAGRGSNIIGTYSTEEKAVKVLDMIQEHQIQTTTSILDYGSVLTSTVEQVRNAVFQMPQDEEIEDG